MRPPPPLEVSITHRTKIKRASACLRHGVIHVQVPRHWPKDLKDEAVLELVDKILKQEAKHDRLLNSPAAQGPRITLTTQAELQAYVDRINAETFHVAINKVRIGRSRYTQLAQMNLKSKTMSVSRYCLTNVPESALRYLIIHELAHCFEASHNQRFWNLVGQFVSDYRTQSRIMKAFHTRAVAQAEAEEGAQPQPAKPLPSKRPEPEPEPKPEGMLDWLLKPMAHIQQMRLFPESQT